MAIEIERKFLVQDDSWRELAHQGTHYRQGYLNRAKEKTVRVRLAGNQGFITIKSNNCGISRQEFEYTIPEADAIFMLEKLCEKPIIEKIRYCITYQNMLWEVDEFLSPHPGLILAEVELQHDQQKISLPSWVGLEVSHDPRYYNSQLHTLSA